MPPAAETPADMLMPPLPPPPPTDCAVMPLEPLASTRVKSPSMTWKLSSVVMAPVAVTLPITFAVTLPPVPPPPPKPPMPIAPE